MLEASVYLAGPINSCTDEECRNWREKLKKRFANCIDPMVRDYRGVEQHSYREIVVLDKRDIRAADIMLANYAKPSVGTSMEIFYAWTLGKPVLVWCDKSATISPWLRYHSTAIVHSLEQVVAKSIEWEQAGMHKLGAPPQSNYFTGGK